MNARFHQRLRRTIIINAPQAEVFRAATDWDRQKEWMLGTTVTGTYLGGHAQGGKLEAFSGFWKIGFLDTMTVTHWDPPRLCSVKHTGTVVRGTGDFEAVRLSDETTMFVWSEETELPFGYLGKVVWIVLLPFIKLAVDYSLRRFKTFTEQTSKPVTLG